VIRFDITPRLFLILAYVPLTIALFTIVYVYSLFFIYFSKLVFYSLLLFYIIILLFLVFCDMDLCGLMQIN